MHRCIRHLLRMQRDVLLRIKALWRFLVPIEPTRVHCLRMLMCAMPPQHDEKYSRTDEQDNHWYRHANRDLGAGRQSVA